MIKKTKISKKNKKNKNKKILIKKKKKKLWSLKKSTFSNIIIRSKIFISHLKF